MAPTSHNFDLRGNFDRLLDFDEEWQLEAYIRKELMTPTLYETLYRHNVTVSDVLNGRLPIGLNHLYNMFFDVWNTKLGRREFGFF